MKPDIECQSPDGLARLSKPELIEQLLEFQNAYAVVREAWLRASAETLNKKSEQEMTNG